MFRIREINIYAHVKYYNINACSVFRNIISSPYEPVGRPNFVYPENRYNMFQTCSRAAHAIRFSPEIIETSPYIDGNILFKVPSRNWAFTYRIEKTTNQHRRRRRRCRDKLCVRCATLALPSHEIHLNHIPMIIVILIIILNVG